MTSPQPPYGPPPPPANPGMSTGKKIGLGCGGCLGVLLFLLLLVGCMAVLGGDDLDSGASEPSATREEAGGETAGGSAAEEADEEIAAEEPAAEEQDVVLTAETTEFTPSILHDGGDFTSVYVTVENNSDENVDVNPLYFALVADDGTKYDTSGGLGEDENQIDTLTLSPGQRAEGVVTAEGAFTPASVEFGGPLGLGETYTVEVG
ncbi:DUF4352 domain-containing protein [Nocardiopsis dassonvillei]|uniref:DUF4352 domain-containing protein n=1 Tax=Nocardiopsis dassonvillei TaxID=2014 RepID=UPI00200EB104|nr:DUF4352 domain-containing protein [Nocardiopsis dassonvillei]MCK9869512.1 DUF4352 domain-containing protein [Nocardiopsis dassonvillei]